MELGLKKMRTTAYNPRSNGLTEQSNSMVKNYLTSVIVQYGQFRNVWDSYLLEACFAYNTSIHSSTGFSPAELMFGWKFRVPLDVIYGTPDSPVIETSVHRFRDNPTRMYNVAREQMNLQQEKYQTYHDKKVADSVLKMGDLMYVFLPCLGKTKLVSRWNGPFKIHAAFHPNYSIKISTDKGPIVKTVTRDNLKLVKNPELHNEQPIAMPGSYIPDPGSRSFTDNVEHLSSDESSVEDNNEPEHRYNLRPRDPTG